MISASIKVNYSHQFLYQNILNFTLFLFNINSFIASIQIYKTLIWDLNPYLCSRHTIIKLGFISSRIIKEVSISFSLSSFILL